MSLYLSGSGIILVLIGAWFVAYEVVSKFRGETHGAVTPMGGMGKSISSLPSLLGRKGEMLLCGVVLAASRLDHYSN